MADTEAEQAPAGGRVSAALDRAVAAWIGGVAGRPVVTLVVLALLLAGAAWAATGLRVDTDSSRMLAAHLGYQQRAQALDTAFPALKESLVVVIRAETADDADRAARTVTERLGRRGDVLSDVFSAATDPVMVRHGLLYLDREELRHRLSRLGRFAPAIAALRESPTLGTFMAVLGQAARASDGFVGPLYAETARVVDAVLEGRPRDFAWTAALGGAGGPIMRTVTARPALDYTRLSPARPAIEAVRAELDAARRGLGPAVEIGLTGDPVLRAEELESVTRTLPLSLGLSLVMVAVLLRIFLRSTGRSLVALLALLTTLVLTTGFAAVAVGALNLISIAFIVLMVGLGIDFAIHVLAHLAEPGPRAIRDRLTGTGRVLGAALCLSALSTALAFLAFTVTDFVGMAQLGLIGGVGVLIAFAVAVTLIPAVAALRPGLAIAAPGRSAPAVPSGMRRGVAWSAALVGLAAAGIGLDVRFEPDPMELRDPGSPSVVAHRWLAASPDTAPDRFSLLAATPEEAAALARRVEGIEGVDHAVWLGDLLPEDQEAKLALIADTSPAILPALRGNGLARALPSMTPAMVAERLEDSGDDAGRRLAATLRSYASRRGLALDAQLEQALFAHFPALVGRLTGQLGASGMTAADLPAPLVRRFHAPDGPWRVEIRAGADLSNPARRRALTERLGAVAPGVTGAPAQIEGARGTVAEAMLLATGLAFVTTGVIAWVVLGRLLAVAAILIPLGLAGAVVAAASVLLDIPFNFANVIVLPLMVGLGVDSGIHMVSRATRSEGGRSVFATSTPRAVLASALTTIAAFGTLGLSAHPGTASMGWMLAIALAASVAMIFALTPALVGLQRWFTSGR